VKKRDIETQEPAIPLNHLDTQQVFSR